MPSFGAGFRTTLAPAFGLLSAWRASSGEALQCAAQILGILAVSVSGIRQTLGEVGQIWAEFGQRLAAETLGCLPNLARIGPNLGRNGRNHPFPAIGQIWAHAGHMWPNSAEPAQRRLNLTHLSFSEAGRGAMLTKNWVRN